MRILLAGQMARDDCLASKLNNHEIHVASEFKNPGLFETAINSGGEMHLVDDITNPDIVANLAKSINAEMFITHADVALANGVVDRVKELLPNCLIPCPTKEEAKLEWDKSWTREVNKLIGYSSINPEYIVAIDKDKIDKAIGSFASRDIEIAVKPLGPAGGRGVVVQGMPGYENYDSLIEYSEYVIEQPGQWGVEINEKIAGREFTVVGFSDGKNLAAPTTPTVDFPFRYDGDEGCGTGGTGSFSLAEGQYLPCLPQNNFNEAIDYMRTLVDRFGYKGTAYPNFFITNKGLKLVEWNARNADPETINILDKLDTEVDFAEFLIKCATGNLIPNDLKLQPIANTAVYYFPPEYCVGKPKNYEFDLDPEMLALKGCKVYFSSCIKIGQNRYKTIGSSRTMLISANSDNTENARNIIDSTMQFSYNGSLDFRKDIGRNYYIDNMTLE